MKIKLQPIRIILEGIKIKLQPETIQITPDMVNIADGKDTVNNYYIGTDNLNLEK